jgi:hypothetical protein
MPAILTHQAIMLLALGRLTDLRDRLLFKKALGTTLTDLELRVLRLASFAVVAMSEGDDAATVDRSDEPDWHAGLGRNASRFAVMGSMGPDIPGLAALLAPAQEVWFDTIHKGTPDSNREQVNARTTDLALEIWTQGSRALGDRPSNAPELVKAAERARGQIRAYVLGHLCHIIGDALAHPYVNDVEWHVPPGETAASLAGRTTNETKKVGHQPTEGSLDTRVAVEVFRRTGPRDGQPWSAHWPSPDDVPQELFVGYEKALAEIYKLAVDRPKGLGAFEKALGGAVPQIPDADYFRDGYRSLHNAGLGILYNWGAGSWFGFLAVALVPTIATFPLAFALPSGKKLFEKSVDDAGERAMFEAFTLPMAMGCIWPIVYGAVIASVTTRGSETISTLGLFGSAFNGIAGVVFLVSLVAPGDPGPGTRWALCFAVPTAIGLAFAVSALVEKARGETRRANLLLLYSVPFLLAVGNALLLMLFSQLVGDTAGVVSWIVLSGIGFVVGLVMWIKKAFDLRDLRLPEEADPFPALRPHAVRLFDRSALYTLPRQHDTPFSEEHYPSGMRPLLKLFWTGPGDFFIRPRRTHIEYVFARDGSPARIVPAPITPMTVQELAAYLTAAVKDAGDTANVLQCVPAFPEDAAVELPPGAAFADHGDTSEHGDDVAAGALADAASEFTKLGTSNDDDAYTLYHAPKRAQALRVDRFGTEPFDDREQEAVEGDGKISGSGTTISGVGTAFRFFFQAGDRIVFNGQTRIVTKVNGDTSLVVSSAFRPAPDKEKYQRLGTDRERTQGFGFVARDRRPTETGDTIMDLAGDVAAVLCLGGTSRTLDTFEAKVADLDDKVAADGSAIALKSIEPAQRVFRNWCLDRRLLDEWRELVSGGAPADPASTADVGTRVLLQQGWVQTLRKWMRVVDAHEQSAVDAGRQDAGPNEPTNLELSQAIARLLDMPAPVAVRRGP